jgi:hypothetical protein
MSNKKLDYAGMQKRIAETTGTTGTAPSGTPVYSREPMTQSQQDSMAAYVKYRIPELKPKGQPKKYIGMQPNKPAPKPAPKKK